MSSKITYENKGALKNDLDVPDKNKVTEDDMNEIKNVVNVNADELDTAKENIGDLQSGQGTASADITNLKNKVATLESDNTTNKSNISNLQSNKVDKIEGKGLSTNDFTNEYKEKLDDLENYDDTEIKKNISDIKEEQVEQNTNTDLIADIIPTLESEEAENINVDSAKYYGQVKVRGKSEQETIPSTEHPSEIKNLSGDIEITVCNKNLFDGIFEQGTIDNQGNLVATSNVIRTKNYIVANGTIVISYEKAVDIVVYAYDSDKKYITNVDKQTTTTSGLEKASLYNLPEKTRYIKFRFNSRYTDLSTKAQVEKSGTATDYIEHEEQKITFPLSEGQKMYDGDYLADDGIHHVRNQDNNVSGTSKTFSNAKENGKYMCNVKESGTLNGKTITFETSVTNAIVEYELAEEETEAYTEAQQEAYDKLKKIMTYYPVTNVYSNQRAKLQLIYKMNLNSMFAMIQENIASKNS